MCATFLKNTLLMKVTPRKCKKPPMLLKSKNVVKLVSIIILIFDFTSIIEISVIFSGLVKVEYQNAYNL